MPEYDDSNIFARIIRGEIPAHKVYEDDQVLAIMDVMPQGTGHTLVIPKTPSRNLLDADPAVLGALLAVTQKIASAVKTAFDADGITIMQFNEAAAGQTVFHLHVHVIPRFEGTPLQRHTGEMEEPAILEENAAKITKALVAG